MKGKIWLFISILCIAAGLGLMLASGLRSGGDLEDVLSGAGYAEHLTEKTSDVDESFHSVAVRASSDDVRLLPAEDGRCRVSCGESERCRYRVSVENGTLTVTLEDEGKGHIGISFSGESIPLRIYLPEQSYKALTVDCSSGDVETAAGFRFDQAQIGTSSGEIMLRDFTAKELGLSSTSGDISLSRCDLGTLTLDSTSGEISLKDTVCTGAAKLRATSGDSTLEDSTLGSLDLSCTSGEVNLTRIVCDGAARVETTSGEITLQDAGAKSFELSANSGDVEGSVRGPVDFIVDSTSGDIHTSGGVRGAAPCRVSTTSGDVDLEAVD